jgi:hypothetical protein
VILMFDKIEEDQKLCFGHFCIFSPNS